MIPIVRTSTMAYVQSKLAPFGGNPSVRRCSPAAAGDCERLLGSLTSKDERRRTEGNKSKCLCLGEGRGFESRHPLENTDTSRQRSWQSVGCSADGPGPNVLGPGQDRALDHGRAALHRSGASHGRAGALRVRGCPSAGARDRPPYPLTGRCSHRVLSHRARVMSAGARRLGGRREPEWPCSKQASELCG
jgi:hypothetical protein